MLGNAHTPTQKFILKTELRGCKPAKEEELRLAVELDLGSSFRELHTIEALNKPSVVIGTPGLSLESRYACFVK